MRLLEEVKRWLGEIIEIALLLVAIGVIAEILFGSTVQFFGGIIPNLTVLINSFGENGLVGLIAMGIILWVFYRRRAPAPQH
ncbi:MAG: hypothetical protein ACYTDW_10560 [Planctomycetota bacterium]|jgi:hypothetical protein